MANKVLPDLKVNAVNVVKLELKALRVTAVSLVCKDCPALS